MGVFSPNPGTRRRRLAWLAAALAMMGVIALPFATAGAGSLEDGNVQKVVRTQLPNWRVGDIDKTLSRMCSLGEFNQRVPYRFSAQFSGPNGAALVGGAKGNGLNLFDPQRKADPDHDYWFFRDRTSDCVVYSAKVKPAS